MRSKTNKMSYYTRKPIGNLFITLVIAFFFNCKTEAQSIYNNHDAKGKKTGYWKVFLDEYLNPTDSINSYYISYNLYENGKLYFKALKMSSSQKSNYSYNGLKGTKGNPVILDGTFTYKKGKKWEYQIYKNGKIHKSIYITSNENDTINYQDKFVIYVDVKFENQMGSYFSENYNYKKELIDCVFRRKVKNKWRWYKVNCNSKS